MISKKLRGWSISLVLAAVVALSTAAAEEYAHTESGKRVLLHDDGTWTAAPKANADSGSESEAAFRGVRWGASREDVIAAEARDPDHEEQGGLVYSTSVAGLDAIAAYRLTHGVVTSGFYAITERHSNRTDYVDDYGKLQRLLTEKYGEPGTDRTVWKNDLYKDDPQYWGTAVAAGHLVFLSVWTTETTEITLMLSGDNYNISLSVLYESLGHAELEESERERESLDGL